MTEQKLISIEQQIESLPPLPMTVADVLKVTNDPKSSANDLVKAILPDQTMCIAVLKIANSVLFGRPKEVSSLETAVTILGFNEVQNIILAKAAVQAFQPLLKTHEAELNNFWDHSFTCGLAAKIISEHINMPSGQFFVAGLLHDIGKLAMLLAFGKRYDTHKWLVGLQSTEKLQEELHTFNITHDVVGSKLLHHWHFPDTLRTALLCHHNPLQAKKLQGYPLVIQLADFLAHIHNLPEKPDEQGLKAALAAHLPEFQTAWQNMHLPWEDITLEEWFAWLKVDRENGSAVLDILAM